LSETPQAKSQVAGSRKTKKRIGRIGFSTLDMKKRIAGTDNRIALYLGGSNGNLVPEAKTADYALNLLPSQGKRGCTGSARGSQGPLPETTPSFPCGGFYFLP
jgi:hypothetical protein